jgi:phosphoglycolate phosphatase
MVSIVIKNNKRKTLQNISAILLDFDGTMIDSTKAILETFKTITKKNSIKYSREGVMSLMGITLEETIAQLYPETSKEKQRKLIDDYREEYQKIHLEQSNLFPCVIPLIREFQKSRLTVIVATNKTKFLVKELLDHHRISNFFHYIITGEDVPKPKPAPDMILKAISELNISKEKCVFIGDSPTDILAGANAGIQVIAVATGPYNHTQLLKEKPYAVIQNLQQLSIKF